MKKSRKNRKSKWKKSEDKKLSRRQTLSIFCGVMLAAVVMIVGLGFHSSQNAQPESGKNAGVDVNSDSVSEDGKSNGQQDQKEETGKDRESGGDGKGSDESVNGLKDSTSGVVLQEGIQGLKLPYQIPGSSLVVSGVASYDGIYLEDGSDTEISGVTVLLLQNSGDTDIEYASVSMCVDGTDLQFDVSDLPADGTAVVQEKNKTLFQKGTYTDCTATVAEVKEFEMSEEQVEVKENEDQSFTVTNITEEDIPAVRVFYKFYMEDKKMYVGGITYTAKITDLKAGESRKITPSHYVSDYSRIMMIRTYDTTE